MLHKLICTIFTASILTIAGVTTSLAGPGNGGGSSATLTVLEGEHLLFMGEEEKLARDTYWAMYASWELVIFENIAASEQNHMDALKNLIDYYGLDDPILGVGDFDNNYLQNLYDDLILMGSGPGTSETDGLKVGALIEETDILGIYDAIAVMKISGISLLRIWSVIAGLVPKHQTDVTETEIVEIN